MLFQTKIIRLNNLEKETTNGIKNTLKKYRRQFDINSLIINSQLNNI
jgi:hypothetical protein